MNTGFPRQSEGDPIQRGEGYGQEGFGVVSVVAILLAASAAFVLFLYIILDSFHESAPAGELSPLDTITVAELLDRSNKAEGLLRSSKESAPRRALTGSAGVVMGKVTAPDDTPVAGAGIKLVPLSQVEGFWGYQSPEVLSEKDGSFEAAAPYSGIFRVEASKGNAVGWIEAASPGSDITIRLFPSTAVTVRVGNLDPNAQAAVRLSMTHPVPGLSVPFRRDGNLFLFEKTPSGSYFLTVRAGGGFLERFVDCREGSPLDLDLLLPEARELRGIVKDAFGLPVEGARVAVSSFATETELGSAVVDEKGTFSFVVPQGRYGIDVEAEDFAPSVLSIAELGTVHEVTLSRGVLYKGKVVDRGGMPLGNAWIRVEYTIPYQDERRHHDIDVAEDGTFLWRSAGDLGERFHVSAPGYGPRFFENLFQPFGLRGNGEEELEPFILFPANLTLGGVVGDEDGADVAGLHLVLVPESVPANSPFYREAWTETDGSGLFQFPSVACGSYRLLVEGGGFARTVKPLFLSKDRLVVLSVGTGRKVIGRVRGRDERPMGGAEVGLVWGRRELNVLANREGRFFFTDVPAGASAVRVRGAGPGLASDGHEILLTLNEGGRFTGRALDERGAPIRFFQAAALLPGESARTAASTWITAGRDGAFDLVLPFKPESILFRKPGCRDLLVSGKDLLLEGREYRLRDDEPVVIEWEGVR